MRAELYSIPETEHGRMAIMPRPRAGDWLEDEIRQLRVAGVDVVISLLTYEEVVELGLEGESQVCRDNQVEFVSFPIADRHVPESQVDTVKMVKAICEWLKQNKGVSIHCRMGIGRSALIAACVLVRQGYAPDDAFEAISKARRAEVPDTVEQHDWVSLLAASIVTQ